MSNEDRCFCNWCGELIGDHKNGIRKGYCHVEQKWGYFSKKDLEIHTFNLCEECYDRLVESFLIPVTVEEQIEIRG